MLLASLSIGLAAPAAANPDLPDLNAANEWNAVGLPAVDPDTDVGPMAVAPDGTLYAGVFYWDPTPATDDTPYDEPDEWFWKVMKSEDNGYTWDDTELTLLQGNLSNPYYNAIVSVVVSPNYEEDETVYVGTYGVGAPPLVYRLEEAGDDYTAIKPIGIGTTYANFLYCIDVWTDEDGVNWILAGTDIDAWVLRDKVFEPWRDQELSEVYGGGARAWEVAFAPDFDDSELIWAVINYGSNFMLTSTESPGNWGQEVDEAFLVNAADNPVSATEFLDIDFPDDYASDLTDTAVFVGFFSPGGGNVNLVLGVAGDGAPATADSTAIPLMEDNENITSIAVSGDWEDAVILAGELGAPIVWFSDDGGATWADADKNPTGEVWTHVYMEADVVWGDAVFDPVENVSFVSTFGDESAVSRSYPNEDGDLLYNQVGLIDTYIDYIDDIAFSPDYPDTPIFLMTTDNRTSTSTYTDSVWLTENGDSDAPDYVRVLCGSDQDFVPATPLPGNFLAERIRLVEFAQDGSAIYLAGRDADWDNSIWKSTDGGQTFSSRRSVKSAAVEAYTNDWVITDSATIYAAVSPVTGDNGFYKTVNGGLSWATADTGGDMNSIALSPDFDAAEEVGYICLGGFGGEVLLSDDVGDAFDDTAADLTGEVYVAFDADYAVEDADGYMLIYAADDDGNNIQVGEVADTDDVDWDALEDDTDEATQVIYATGLQVAADNALYAIGTTEETVTTTVTVTASGTVPIVGATSAATGQFSVLSGDTFTKLTGTFTNGEILNVITSALTEDPDEANRVVGTLTVQGVLSGATGRITIADTADRAITGIVGVFVNGEVLIVTGSSLIADVTTGTTPTGVPSMVRLLLHEDDSIWESADTAPFTATNELQVPFGLWLTAGSNVLWTIDSDTTGTNEYELWVFEDLLSGQVTLESPADKAKLDREDIATLMWTALDDADEYGYEYNSTWTLATKSGTTDEVWIGITGLSASDTYEWRVRVYPGEPFSSRWSDLWTFGTALGASPWAPECIAPGNGDTGVPLTPAFSWESAKAADTFEFVLATDSAFTAVLVTETVSTDAFQPAVTLEYDTNYYWKVRALKAAVAISRWSDISVFTTAAEVVAPAEVWTCPLDGLTFDSQAALQAHNAAAHAPVVPLTPAYIWAIVIIGAILVIAVIVLIVTTRRVP
jgi:hypothetical protein